MDLFKKYINVILLVLTVLSTSASFAADSNTSIPISDCGVESNVVKIFNGEICEQDLSFRMIYKLFPTVIENFVFPMINSEYLHLVPQIEQQNLHIYQTQELIFFEIFKATNKISFFIISLFVIWHFLFLGLIRSANDGEFLGKSWKTSSVLTKYGVLLILLTPVSDTGVLVIHIILLAILVLGIYFANYFWGVYLNYLQIGENSIDISRTELSVADQKAGKASQFDTLTSKYDHNYFFAYSYAKELSLIALCKGRTEKLLVLGSLPFLTETNVGDLNKCLVNDTSKSSWMMDSAYNIGTRSFSHYKNEKSNHNMSMDKKRDFFITGSIEFSNKDFKQCQSSSNDAFSSFDYNCGKIKMTNPTLPSGNIKKAIDKSNFYTEYVSASNAVMTSDDPSETVISSWNTISNNIDVLFDNDDPLSSFKHNQSMIKKNISFYFHKLLMKDALIGSSNYSNREMELPQQAGNFNLLMGSYLKDAKKVSNSIETLGCLQNSALYSDAKKAKSLIESYQNGSPRSVSDYNTSCLDVETLEILGVDPKPYLEQDDKGKLLEKKIEEERFKVAIAGINHLKALTERIRKKREAVERSFYLSIINAPSNDLANRLRKEGWAISGGYMLKLLSEKEVDNKLRHSLQNSTVAKAAKMSRNGLPDLDTNAILKEESANQLKQWFDLTMPKKIILEDPMMKPARKDLKYVDVSQHLDDKIFSGMSSSDFDSSGKEDFISLIFSGKLADNVKSVVGIKESGELSMAQISQCISPEEGSDLNCPMNLTNPIMEITQLGHSLINISTKIIVAAITVALFEVMLLKGRQLSANRSNKGTVGAAPDTTRLDKDAADSAKKTGSASNTAAKFIKGFGTFLHYFFQIAIGMATFLLTVGFTLAYVIPLIPFIAFTIAFISWIVISLEILIIAPIWLSFLFRLEDSNRPSSELYMAGFNFVMQMLFRPALIVIAIVVGWSLFAVIFMAINFSMAIFMQGFNDSGFLITIIYSLLLIISYSLVIYVSIKQVFDLMIMLPNKIFTKIGVQPIDASFESNAKDTLSNFTMGGVAVSGIASKTLGDKLKSNVKETKHFKKQQYEKTQDFKKKTAAENDEKKENKQNEKGKLENE